MGSSKKKSIRMENEPEILTLTNGMKLSYLQVDNAVAHLGVTINAGSRFEGEGEEGLAHFLEHCIFKGTKNRRAFHILSRLDSVGGELNAYTTKEEICIYAAFTTAHFDRASELLFDITFNSTFPEKEIEREKEVVLDEINSYLDSPSDRIFDDFEALMFPNHPLGTNILGTKETVASFTREDLLSYVERFFFPDNMVLSFVGNVPKSKVLKILNKYFGEIQINRTLIQPVLFNEKSRFSVALDESNYQAHILLGGLAPGIEDQRRRTMTLLINILGGPALNSKLTLSIREKYGYAYNIEANYSPYKEVGFWSIYAGTDPKYVKKTIKLIHKELNLFCQKKMTDSQLNKAKIQLKGHLALGMDSNAGLMLNFGKSLLVFGQIDTLDEIHDIIDNITAQEIQDIACEFFDPSGISTLVFNTK